MSANEMKTSNALWQSLITASLRKITVKVGKKKGRPTFKAKRYQAELIRQSTCTFVTAVKGSSYLTVITHLITSTSFSFKTNGNGKSSIFCHFFSLGLSHLLSLNFCLTTFRLLLHVARDDHRLFPLGTLKYNIFSGRRLFQVRFW